MQPPLQDRQVTPTPHKRITLDFETKKRVETQRWTVSQKTAGIRQDHNFCAMNCNRMDNLWDTMLPCIFWYYKAKTKITPLIYSHFKTLIYIIFLSDWLFFYLHHLFLLYSQPYRNTFKQFSQWCLSLVRNTTRSVVTKPSFYALTKKMKLLYSG